MADVRTAALTNDPWHQWTSREHDPNSLVTVIHAFRPI